VKAFTLIELMVTIVVVLVLSGTSIPAFLKFNKTQTIDSDSRQIISELNKNRSLASNLVYPSGCVHLSGYEVKSDVDLTGFVVSAKCFPSDVISASPNLLKSSKFLNAVDITFNSGSGYLDSGTETLITIVNNDDVDTKKVVTVSVYGSSF
jgi:prepilin-type N-terminal cleavage/methylation domain-containing protein